MNLIIEGERARLLEKNGAMEKDAALASILRAIRRGGGRLASGLWDKWVGLHANAAMRRATRIRELYIKQIYNYIDDALSDTRMYDWSLPVDSPRGDVAQEFLTDHNIEFVHDLARMANRADPQRIAQHLARRNAAIGGVGAGGTAGLLSWLTGQDDPEE